MISSIAKKAMGNCFLTWIRNKADRVDLLKVRGLMSSCYLKKLHPMLIVALLALIGCKDEEVVTVPAPRATVAPSRRADVGVRKDDTPVWAVLPRHCPAGSMLYTDIGLCVENEMALGPFTESVIKRCRERDAKSTCEAAKMPVDLARFVRGAGPCMAGAKLNRDGLCEDSGLVYGPFPKQLVLGCLRLKAKQCDSMRWTVTFARQAIQKYEAIKNEPGVDVSPVETPDLPKQTQVPASTPTVVLTAVATQVPAATPSATPAASPVARPQPTEVPSPADNEDGICVKSWEDAPGTADYTTIDWFERSAGYQTKRRFDRAQEKTLQGSGRLAKLSLCERAKVLKPCFEKNFQLDKKGNAKKLTDWARSKNLDYVLMRMAFAVQETNLGNAHDQCYKRSCNGIGLMQVIDAYTSAGEKLPTTDKRWDGVAFNILTNLSYSSRIMERKLAGMRNGGDLRTLAERYNSNPDLSIRYAYGANVPKWYHLLEACRLYK